MKTISITTYPSMPDRFRVDCNPGAGRRGYGRIPALPNRADVLAVRVGPAMLTRLVREALTLWAQITGSPHLPGELDDLAEAATTPQVVTVCKAIDSGANKAYYTYIDKQPGAHNETTRQ